MMRPVCAVDSVASTSGKVARRSPPDSAVRYSLTNPSSRSLDDDRADVERVLGPQLAARGPGPRADHAPPRCSAVASIIAPRRRRVLGREDRLAERRARS